MRNLILFNHHYFIPRKLAYFNLDLEYMKIITFPLGEIKFFLFLVRQDKKCINKFHLMRWYGLFMQNKRIFCNPIISWVLWEKKRSNLCLVEYLLQKEKNTLNWLFLQSFITIFIYLPWTFTLCFIYFIYELFSFFTVQCWFSPLQFQTIFLEFVFF